MDELKSQSSKVPLKSTSNDAAMLRAVVADLNNTALTGAVMTAEERAENERIMQTEFAKAESVENIPQSAQVAAVAPLNKPSLSPEASIHAAPPITRPAKFFLTGLPGTGISELIKGCDAHVFNLRELVTNTLKTTCMLAASPTVGVVTEFRGFGNGHFTPTLANIFFLGLIRRSYPTFGTPGFWSSLVLQALEHDCSDKQVIVLDLTTSHEFKALIAAGFTHYHVMRTAGARSIAGAPEPAGAMAAALESDVHRKISLQRNGPRLNVVWNDTSAPPSTRFISETIFKKEIVGVIPSEVDFETLQVL